MSVVACSGRCVLNKMMNVKGSHHRKFIMTDIALVDRGVMNLIGVHYCSKLKLESSQPSQNKSKHGLKKSHTTHCTTIPKCKNGDFNKFYFGLASDATKTAIIQEGISLPANTFILKKKKKKSAHDEIECHPK